MSELLFKKPPAKAREIFAHFRFMHEEPPFESDAEGRARMDTLTARILSRVAEGKFTLSSADLTELSYELRRGAIEQEWLRPFARRLIETYFDTGRTGSILELIYSDRIREMLEPLDQSITRDEARKLGKYALTYQHPDNCELWYRFFSGLYPDVAADIKRQQASQRRGNIKDLWRNIRDNLQEDYIVVACTGLNELRNKWRVSQKAIDAYGRHVLAVFIDAGHPECALELLEEAGRLKTFSTYDAIGSGTQVKQMADAFLAGGRMDKIERLQTLSHKMGPDLQPQARAALAPARGALLEHFTQSITDAFTAATPADGWKKIERMKEILQPDSDEMRALGTNIVDAMLARPAARHVDILHFISTPDYGLHFRHDILTAGQARALYESMTAAATSNDRPYLRTSAAILLAEHYPQYGYAAPKTGEILDALAPILDHRMEPGFDAFLLMPLRTAAHAQNSDLAPVWNALAQEGVADRRALRALFGNVATFMNLVQTQRPVIAPLSLNEPNLFSRYMAPDNAYFDGYGAKLGIGISGLFGVSTIAYDRGMPLRSKFDFMLVRKRETRMAAGTPVTEDKLYALPLLMIHDSIYHATRSHGMDEILRTLQDIESIKNHDYFHHLTARNINAYFLVNGAALREGQQPYARILSGRYETGMLTLQSDLPFEWSRSSYLHIYHSDVGRRAGLANLGENPYEFHALHTHAQLYRARLDHTVTGRKLKKKIDIFFDGVEKLAGLIRKDQSECTGEADIVMLYYAGLIYNSLLYIVPHTHPLLQQCEKRIDALGIDRKMLKNTLRQRASLRKQGTCALVSAESGVDYTHPETLTPGEIMRWQGYALGRKFLTPLHEADEETCKAIMPSLNTHLSVVSGDFKMVRQRGGMAQYDRALADYVAERKRNNERNPHLVVT